MLLFLVLTWLLSPTATAQSCWRDIECTGPTEAAFPGPWSDNIYAPASRTVSPASAFPLHSNTTFDYHPNNFILSGNGSAWVFDFGKEVGGIVTINYSTNNDSGAVGLAFTEAKDYVGYGSDSSNSVFAGGNVDQSCNDGALYSNFTGQGNHSYTMDLEHLRGGFRYLTIFLLTNETSNFTLSIQDISLEIGFHPTWSNLRAYQGYFHSNDDELNKIWYSGAYTLQTNYVPTYTGRWYDGKRFEGQGLRSGWANNGTLSNGSTVVVDGAKRDRAVWPGDMGIAVPSSFVSLGNDLESVKNALQVMYDYQNADGSIPEAGPPLLQQGSDTYHMWTLIGTYNYILYTNDTAFLEKNWAKYEYALEFVYNKVLQPLGLLNVTGTRDWARQATGGNSSEPNMILYHTLNTASSLATWNGLSDLSATYLSRASALATAIATNLYNSTYGAFRDNTTDIQLYPQDANSMSLLFGVIPANTSIAQEISNRLTDNWTPIGAETPELPNNISPFISSFEVQAHFTIGQTARALDLIRRTWGWYLNHPNGTQSTVIEGYLTNGSFGYRNYRGYYYDTSYVSHSHGWSSGPTSALTEFVLGLRIVERIGSRWTLKPQFGDLTSVEGGFVTSLGKFQAGWNRSSDGYELSWSVPEGTRGTVVLPGLGEGNGTASVAVEGMRKRDTIAANEQKVLEVDGGSGRVVVQV